eukprot:365025-Chlamydomonas_euryale.AAC.9
MPPRFHEYAHGNSPSLHRSGVGGSSRDATSSWNVGVAAKRSVIMRTPACAVGCIPYGARCTET